MPTTKLNNSQLPTTLSSKTIDSSNDINTTLARLSITGGTNGQVLSTNGSGSLSWTTAGGGGGISDGDKGDITVSDSGATWTIDSDVVTYAKIQNVSATSRLLGRASAGSGDVEEITIGSGLSLTGTTLSASGGGGGGANEPSILIVKSADETVVNSTTFQDDDHLFATLDANSYYFGEIDLLLTKVNQTATPQFKFAIQAGGLGAFRVEYPSTSYMIMDGIMASVPINAVSLTSPQVPSLSRLSFAIKTGSTTQNLQFRFAQSTAVPSGAVVMKGSCMKIWKRDTV